MIKKSRSYRVQLRLSEEELIVLDKMGSACNLSRTACIKELIASYSQRKETEKTDLELLKVRSIETHRLLARVDFLVDKTAQWLAISAKIPDEKIPDRNELNKHIAKKVEEYTRTQ